MKKLSAYLFVLLFTLQTSSLAVDIRDFQIEGMSVGDSLLDYYNEAKIKKVEKSFYPKSKKFYMITPNEKYELYEAVTFTLKSKDKDYKIYQLKGLMTYENKLNECLEEKDKILKEFSNILKNSKEENYTDNFGGALGKSIAYISDFKVSNGFIRVWCADWDKKTEKEKNWVDTLNVDASSQEYLDWLNNEAN